MQLNSKFSENVMQLDAHVYYYEWMFSIKVLRGWDVTKNGNGSSKLPVGGSKNIKVGIDANQLSEERGATISNISLNQKNLFQSEAEVISFSL